jgi:tripartite ATP-independent transporter DctM subunit
VELKKLPSKASSILSSAENIICFGTLALLALIPMAEFILRKFQTTIPDSRYIITYLFMISCFFATMLTVKLGEHISITAIQFIKSEKIKKILVSVSTFVSIFVLSILVWNCICYIKYNDQLNRLIGFVPCYILAIAMPLGYAVIAIRFCLKFTTWKERLIAIAILLLGTAAALPAIAKIIWGEPPEPYYSWVNNLYDIAIKFPLPPIIFLIVLAFCGMPIFVAIGGIAMVMLQSAGLEPEAAPIQIYDALTNVKSMDLVAIPLFTLTGFFLSESKAGERLVRTFRAFFGWMPGGMIIATVIICAFFTSFTGASGVTILALGGILYTILRQNNYSEKFSIGMLTSAGGVGILFPPSLPIIMVATSSNTILHFMNIPIKYDIIDFFIGALIPGIVLILAMIATGFVLTGKVKMATEPFNGKEALRALKESLFEILLPIILIAGYFTGQLTLVEVSALSVIYVLIIEVFVNKDIAFADITKVFSKAVPIIGGVLAILVMAKALSYAFVDSGVPESLAFWMQDAVRSKILFLLLLNIALLILGCVMDIFSAILVLLPLIVPLGNAYGIDPLHLGIIFIINLEAGFLTPPVGINLFLASYRFEKPFLQICYSVLPFLAVRLIVVLLVTYIPWLSLFLVGLF